uniref:Uncharacterized protein n=1 Tax=Lygus hesperus TaxID=30085 RepID=A0A146M8B6_LYGHE
MVEVALRKLYSAFQRLVSSIQPTSTLPLHVPSFNSQVDYLCIECDGWVLYRSGIFASLQTLNSVVCSAVLRSLPHPLLDESAGSCATNSTTETCSTEAKDDTSTAADYDGWSPGGSVEDTYVKDRTDGWIIVRRFTLTRRLLIVKLNAVQHPSLLEVQQVERNLLSQLTAELVLR